MVKKALLVLVCLWVMFHVASETNDTETNSKIPAGTRLLFVTRAPEDSLSAGDKILLEFFKSLGLEVVIKDNRSEEFEDSETVDIIYVSESCDSKEVADTFYYAEVPLISAEHYIADDMSFCGYYLHSDYGQTDPKYTQVSIVNKDHFLAAGFTGKVTVFSEKGKYCYSKPKGEVDIIATLPDDDTAAVIYAYDKGAKNSDGEPVMAKRVMIFPFSEEEKKLTEDGWKLIETAFIWCLQK